MKRTHAITPRRAPGPPPVLRAHTIAVECQPDGVYLTISPEGDRAPLRVRLAPLFAVRFARDFGRVMAQAITSRYYLEMEPRPTPRVTVVRPPAPTVAPGDVSEPRAGGEE